MPSRIPRRTFLLSLPAVAGLGVVASPLRLFAETAGAEAPAPASLPGEAFPRTDAELVGKVVGAAHSDLAEVRRMVERQPSLARASWDWGFGDWETALGAAAHTGRREIAELLLAHGARPTIFSAAMMGQLDVVKAFIAAMPGVQRTHGPHGIPLMAHAQAGGPAAEPVVKYLESVGDADVRAATAPLDAADRDALAGRYVYGGGARDLFEVDVRKEQLGMLRPGASRRILFHAGGLVFYPAGVPTVKIAFTREGARVTGFTIADPEVFLTARREG